VSASERGAANAQKAAASAAKETVRETWRGKKLMRVCLPNAARCGKENDAS
jgi:hypothetical protein